VSLAARADGSYDEALIDSNSCMDRERSVRDTSCDHADERLMTTV
jgi:hypothetical protein